MASLGVAGIAHSAPTRFDNLPAACRQARPVYNRSVARPASTIRMTHAEYLAAEAVAAVRHEYLDGEVWDMAGGTIEHGAIAAAIAGDLRAGLRGKPCRTFSSDVRIQVLDTGLTTYPDLSVVCGRVETAADDPDAITNPIVLVEVLSDSTEAYDRGAKAAHYRRIPSLREYVLVSQSEPRIEVFRRIEGGRWELHEARAGETIALDSLGVRIDVAAIYANPLEQR
jgi:Uma2 family endonuclease